MDFGDDRLRHIPYNPPVLEPGAHAVDVLAYGHVVVDCAELRPGSDIGPAGKGGSSTSDDDRSHLLVDGRGPKRIHQLGTHGRVDGVVLLWSVQGEREHPFLE